MTKSRGGLGKMDMQAGAKIKFQFYKLYSDLESFNASQEYSDMAIEKAMV